jgi:hypothetical protein
VSDVAEIAGLVYSYALFLDRGDIDGVVALFEHSTWRGDPNGPVLRGVAEIRPVYERLLTALGNLRTKHLLTNLAIEIHDGGATAASHCYWTVLQNTRPGASIDVTLSGQYADRFEKVDGTWRFAERTITTDLFGDATTGGGSADAAAK